MAAQLPFYTYKKKLLKLSKLLYCTVYTSRSVGVENARSQRGRFAAPVGLVITLVTSTQPPAWCKKSNKPRGLQRDVVYLCRPIAPSYTSPNAGG
jgi:hypothetical protein